MAPPRVIAADQLIRATDASLARFKNVQAAFAVGGPFSDDLSRAATDAAVRAVLSKG